MPSESRSRPGLRERKKQAARRALSEAALRLAVDRGLDQVKVEDIAAEVGVSPRTFNNYFSCKEEAVCEFVVDRQHRVRDALLARPAEEPLWEAITGAVLEQYSRDGEPDRAYVSRVRALMGHAALRGEFLKAHHTVERLLADAIIERAEADTGDELYARLMAGAVESAVRLAFVEWFTSDQQVFLPTLTRLLGELSAGFPTLTTTSGRRDTDRESTIA
ncbi:TetR/AcrR family transcriptional regulator [Amycolatopsis sp. NPDC059027]|uniref:TetR/AcrR family transcriptional regulator n=1 Tax=unclassified Amycolatopsis TaxID=2618356 RepID=UPI00366FFE91